MIFSIDIKMLVKGHIDQWNSINVKVANSDLDKAIEFKRVGYAKRGEYIVPKEEIYLNNITARLTSGSYLFENVD